MPVETEPDANNRQFDEIFREFFLDGTVQLTREEENKFFQLFDQFAKELEEAEAGSGETIIVIGCRFIAGLADRSVFRSEVREAVPFHKIARLLLSEGLDEGDDEANLTDGSAVGHTGQVDTEQERRGKGKGTKRLAEDAFDRARAESHAAEALHRFRSLSTDYERQQFVAAMTFDEREQMAILIETSERESYQKLVFGNQRPTIARFNKWLRDKANQEFPPSETKLVARAAIYVRNELGLQFVNAAEDELVSCQLDVATGRAGRLRFRLRESGGDRRILESRYAFPKIEAIRP